MNNNKQKHLTLDDRITIELGVSNNMSMKEIAELLGKDNSTISKEIKLRRIFSKQTSFRDKNNCLNFRSCSKTNICKSTISCGSKLCRRCNMCTTRCDDYIPDICKKLLKAPHVCNGCDIFRQCNKTVKYKYSAKAAQKSYEYTLVDSRVGINMELNDFIKLNNLLTPLIKQNKQPLSHILATHKDEIPCSIRTIYNYIENGVLDVINVDLPRKVRYKPRKQNTKVSSTSKLRKTRTYDMYLDYIKEHPECNIIEMDTVEGCKDDAGPYLLTLFDKRTHLQLAHIIPSKKKTIVPKVFELYKELLDKIDPTLFNKYFDVILTDNGIEFTGIEKLEEMGCKVFFCNPNRSDQKGSCERNHEYIRFFLSKGTSFKELTQMKVWRMMSHINSVKRPSLNNKSPIEVTSFYWDNELIKALNLQEIHPDNVTLSSKVIK